jgi:hypothetical protein
MLKISPPPPTQYFVKCPPLMLDRLWLCLNFSCHIVQRLTITAVVIMCVILGPTSKWTHGQWVLSSFHVFIFLLSTRHRKQRGEVVITVDSSETVRDIKLEVRYIHYIYYMLLFRYLYVSYSVQHKAWAVTWGTYSVLLGRSQALYFILNCHWIILNLYIFHVVNEIVFRDAVGSTSQCGWQEVGRW